MDLTEYGTLAPDASSPRQIALPLPRILPRLVEEENLAGHGSDQAFLTCSKRPDPMPMDGISVVDLFAGCGGLTLGIEQAARSFGRGLRVAGILENDPHAAACFSSNFQVGSVIPADVRSVFLPEIGPSLSPSEAAFKDAAGAVTFLVGGPPCQGHSDLNNFSRREDPKNSLYFTMARAAKVLAPEHVIIENVPGSQHDRDGVVARTIDALRSLGYSTSRATVDLSILGVPQTRKRFIVVASRRPYDVTSLAERHKTPVRTVRWAIGDLEHSSGHLHSLLDEPANSNPATRSRVRYLFENDCYDLPDSERPPCHRDKAHSYKSIYGRLRWDAPAQTITRGFYSMCMGRYVHPSQPRTLTAHEAARLQFFPDYYDFSAVRNRGALATLIGNAVPMKLSFLIAKDLLQI